MRHILLGFIDGLITASTLASSLIIRGAKISVYFAVSLSILVATINLINAFVAEYVHQRREAEEVYYKITLNDVKDIKWGYLKRIMANSLKDGVRNFGASLGGALIVLLPSTISSIWGLTSMIIGIILLSYHLAGDIGKIVETAILIGLAVAMGLIIGLIFPIVA
ncbi:MAG: hypothetical protein NDF51_03005 [archaeon YNP-WB-040]|jgi:hypothetical protein|nr:hypothetical protein [Candidatus Culexarchaeum yellowstonense]